MRKKHGKFQRASIQERLSAPFDSFMFQLFQANIQANMKETNTPFVLLGFLHLYSEHRFVTQWHSFGFMFFVMP